MTTFLSGLKFNYTYLISIKTSYPPPPPESESTTPLSCRSIPLYRSEPPAYPGENSISVRILSLANSQPGFFVDMGANNGLNSNSHLLEQVHGWCGLCIEAGPRNYLNLKANRPRCNNVNVAVSDTSENSIFREFPPSSPLFGHSGFKAGRSDSEWAGLIKKHATSPNDIEVRTSTLRNIFRENKINSIEYFSLDVEGYEMKILLNYPFDEFPVKIWSIESNKLSRPELLEFMGERGYFCEHYDKINTICILLTRGV
ncbi:hypothetical protein ScalyP_jg2885 [Parmales sp. scaly parma]|nr:hypothetical protein ScalyP_jg2885 [Parmales sp. scaly parma]